MLVPFLSVCWWLPSLILVSTFAKIIIIPFVYSCVIHEHTKWLLFNCLITLNKKWIFFQKIVSVFLRPTNTVNSYGPRLCQESRVQGHSVLSLFYAQQTCTLILMNEGLLPGPIPHAVLFKDFPFKWLFQHLSILLF